MVDFVEAMKAKRKSTRLRGFQFPDRITSLNRPFWERHFHQRVVNHSCGREAPNLVWGHSARGYGTVAGTSLEGILSPPVESTAVVT